MSDEDDDDTYKINRSVSDIESSQDVYIEAPTKAEAMEMFDEVWEDD